MTSGSSPLEQEVSAASFRDPAGFVFSHGGVVHRQVNTVYVPHFAHLMESGLYDELTGRGLLVSHEVVDVDPPRPELAASVIRPAQVPFVSYPYEWCFGQLQDAAAATLEIQLAALDRGMTLKDSTAFNIQFVDGCPTLIDTLSFERYEAGRPWVAYRQFCEHFLGPLLLATYQDPWLLKTTQLTVDGIPLELTSKLLPWRSRFRPLVQLHIHQHARLSRRYGGSDVPDRVKQRGLSRSAMQNLVEGLLHQVRSLDWRPSGTQWADYESEHGYSSGDHRRKAELVEALLKQRRPERVWDLGANTGDFSRIARETGAWVLSADLDPAAVERNYRRLRGAGKRNIHPLVLDLRNPTPAVGWALAERDDIASRVRADSVLALALIHHLAIGSNIPLASIAAWFSRLAPHLLVEFVPKDDPQVSRLLVSREDIFTNYSQATFETVFRSHFRQISCHRIGDSGRSLYEFEVG